MNRLLLCGGAFVAILASSAQGQVVQTQYGRALDASFYWGSGGYNSIRQNDRALNGNLYVTGQVSGLYGFHGPQPYSGPDQLTIDVPSAGMNDFLRRSAGVPQPGSGQSSYGPQMYLSQQQTVVGPAGIAAGMNAPGSSAPAQSYVPSNMQRLYDDAMTSYRRTMPDLGRQYQVSGLAVTAPQGMALPPPAAAAPEAVKLQALALIRPTASSLFGVLKDQEEKKLAQELDEARQGADRRPADPRQKPQQSTPPGQEAQPKPQELQPAGPDKFPQTSGEDIFYDLLLSMQRMQEAPEQAPPAPRDFTPVDPTIKPSGIPMARRDPAAGSFEATRQGLDRAKLIVERTNEELVLHGLAGQSRDLFNLRMTQGEKFMAQGKFYEAAGAYQVAAIVNRTNPLASMGGALALFAANEPLSAGLRLREAMGRFPPIMKTGLDLDKLVGRNVVLHRLEALDKRLASDVEHPDSAIVFLAAFIRHNLHQDDQAATLARRLKNAPGATEIERSYADFILKAAPQSQPANAAGAAK